MAELYKSSDAPEVYEKTDTGLRHIADPQTFEGLGYKWEDIVTLQPSMLESFKTKYGVGQPINAQSLTQPSGLSTLNYSPYTGGSLSDLTASFYKSQQSYLDFQQQEAQRQLETRNKLEAQQQELTKQYGEIASGMSYQKSLSEAYDRYGINEGLQQQKAMLESINVLQSRLDALNNEEQTVLYEKENNLIAQGASPTFLDRERAKLQRLFSIRRQGIATELASQSSVLAAQQGLLSQAKEFADKAVDASMYDQKLRLDSLQFIITQNQDLISAAGKDYKDSLDRMYQVQKEAYETAKEEKTQVMNLAIQYPMAFGGTMPDNLESATKSVLRYYEEHPELTIKTPDLVGGGDVGYYQYDPSTKTWNQVISPKPASAGGGGMIGNVEIAALAQAVMNNPNAINAITPSKVGSVLAYLERAGYDTSALPVGQKDLSAKQVETLSDFEKSIQAWENVRKIAEKFKNQFGPTRYAFYKGPVSQLFLQRMPTELAALQSEVDKAFQLYRKETTGAQASDKELARLQPNLPRLTDTPALFFQKLENTVEDTARAKDIFLGSLGAANYNIGNFTSIGDDFNSTPSASVSLNEYIKEIQSMTNTTNQNTTLNYTPYKIK